MSREDRGASPRAGLRVDGEPGQRAGLADGAQHGCRVVARLGLHVNRHPVRAGLDEIRDVPLRLLDHEMHVERHGGGVAHRRVTSGPIVIAGTK